MNKVILAGFLATETAAIFLSQTDLISDQMIGVFLQLPVVGIYAYSVAFILKWTGEQIAAIRAVFVSEMEAIRAAHQEQLSELFGAFKSLSGSYSDLNKQVAINTTVVNEGLRSQELAEDIKAVLIGSKSMEN